ncbi:MAG: recombinase family protein [Myxococcales bacterium]|nr:recombinase family protein [Myxococcales bacterium]
MRSVSSVHKGFASKTPSGHYSAGESQRRAVGYVRVSTDMQAIDGLSLEAQQSAIEAYCSLHGLKLVRICKDVMSGGKDQRPGLQDALDVLQRSGDVLVVLKFDRLSRSIVHFCELYERYFKSGEKELVAIREAIRLDSALGRALINILLVFAQMEREATGERTREAIRHIRDSGYHFGKVPYGKKAIPAPDHPRMKILVEDAEEQAVIAKLKTWALEGVGITEMANRLNAAGTPPPQGQRWTKSLIYNLRLRLSHISPRPINERPHTDEEVKARIVELRGRGHSHRQIASILNEQGWIPLKGRQFTERNVRGLLLRCDEKKLLTPRRFLLNVIERLEMQHESETPSKPFERPSLPALARLLSEAGYTTPRGHVHWWPAQVQQLMEGRFEQYYSAHPRSPSLAG